MHHLAQSKQCQKHFTKPVLNRLTQELQHTDNSANSGLTLHANMTLTSALLEGFKTDVEVM